MLLNGILDYLYFLWCKPVKLIDHLVNLALQFLDLGSLGRVRKIVFVFGDV